MGHRTYVDVLSGNAIYRVGELFETMGQNFYTASDAREFIKLTKAGRNQEARKLVVPKFN
jgi:hypothetical protein